MPAPSSPEKRSKVIGVIAVAGLLCTVSALAAYHAARTTALSAKPDAPRETIQPPDTPLANAPINEPPSPPLPSEAEQAQQLYDQRWHVSDLKDFVLQKTTYASRLIAWRVPEAQPDFRGFSANVPGSPPNPDLQYADDPASPFLVGRVLKDKYKGFFVYTADFSCEGPCSLMARFLSDGKTVVLLSKYSDQGAASTLQSYVQNAGKYAFKEDADFVIPEFDFPKTITLTEPAATLKLAPPDAYRFYQFFSPPSDQKPAFEVPGHGPAYRRDNEGSFVVQAPDGSPQRYYIEIPLVTDKNAVPNITWNDGKANTVGYIFRSFSGCGFTSYAQIVDMDMAKLDVGGKTAKGDPVYLLKDENDPLYSTYYENVYYAPEGQKKSFRDFVAARPFFYWKDPFGRLVQFTNVEFQSQAECGKPVIYLYPTVTTDVSVQVEPTGGMTKSDPDYGNGWEVTAHPDGSLVQKGTGKPYPYLFWEGRSDSLWQMPDSGFVVAQKDVAGFLNDKLAALGLNAREAADFKEFWLPRFSGHPYYLVTFSGNALMDGIAPLSITPEPDTVIRILMDFKGLDAPITVREPVLKKPARNGFTVVEWGGVIR